MFVDYGCFFTTNISEVSVPDYGCSFATNISEVSVPDYGCFFTISISEVSVPDYYVCCKETTIIRYTNL
jgi:hypothetical protein